MQAEWRDLANELEVDSETISKLSQDVLLDKLTFSDIPKLILQDWRMRKGNEATLANLIESLDRIGWLQVSSKQINV